jgi:soluble lytic murein transglycosylase-like protein
MRFGCVFRSPDEAKRNPGFFSRIALRSMRATIPAIAALALISPALAQESPDQQAPAANEEKADAPAPETPAPAPSGEATESICLLIESAAAANGLPVEFFARVIWRESHYNPNAVGPPTRSGERAQGIGQFTPGTVRSGCAIGSPGATRCRGRRATTWPR